MERETEMERSTLAFVIAGVTVAALAAVRVVVGVIGDILPAVVMVLSFGLLTVAPLVAGSPRRSRSI